MATRDWSKYLPGLEGQPCPKCGRGKLHEYVIPDQRVIAVACIQQYTHDCGYYYRTPLPTLERKTPVRKRDVEQQRKYAKAMEEKKNERTK